MPANHNQHVFEYRAMTCCGKPRNQINIELASWTYTASNTDLASNYASLAHASWASPKAATRNHARVRRDILKMEMRTRGYKF